MTIPEARQIHDLLVQEKWTEAANLSLSLAGQKPVVKTKAQALDACRGLIQFLLDDEQYLVAATILWGGEVFNAEPECVRRVFHAMHTNAKVLFQGASSMGKCLHPETGVRMFDGSVKRAKDVVVGDLLMGDDSTPRRVLNAAYGYGKLHRITPERGDSWICNSDHILTLRVSAHKRCGSGVMSKKWRKGDVVDVPIQEYVSMSKDRKSRLKQFHVGVEYPSRPVPFDPYIYGAWLGDGGTAVPCLHTPEGPMSIEWKRYFESIGMRVSVGYAEGSCQMWSARTASKAGNTPNPFTQFIKTSVRNGEKFIREDYLVNSRQNRMKLLAGLIDSDGWVHCKTAYGFTSKFEALARQVQLLARSLGLAAVCHPKIHTIKSIGFSATYWTVHISGECIEEIPTLEKRAKKSVSAKNLNNTGFTVESAGDGVYCGFAVDGNHRYLLEDYTVTHNSYSCGAWMYLDWRRDPWYTGVKCVGVSDDQVRKNVFAHILKLHRAASIPMLEEITVRDSDMWMGIKEAGFEFGITAVAYKQSQETSGAIKGYKSMPVRKKPHPKFGVMSRLRLLGDEGQNWPNGPFQDLNTWISQIEGTEIVKIAIAFNPEFTSKLVVQMAEPDHGWDIDDVDQLYDWDSKFGWRVCRLDAAKCENVIKREKVYHGLQTYDGFMSYLKAGGDASASYFTFARGFPPLKGSVNTIIPPAWPQEQRGEAVFIDTPKTIAAVDLAFMGQDSAQMAVGRWGLASGWHDSKGKYTKFMDRLNISSPKPRHVLQIDQILPLEKHDDTSKMAEEIIGRCKMLGIPPSNLGVDKTGIGLGTYSHLARVWGDVIGIGWGDGATDLKILAEDKEPASMQCEGISSEMWWTFRRWLDPRCCAILINPIIPTQPIQTQLTSRRYRTGKRGIKVESKEEYKARNQKSPDEVDACIMLPLVVRRISDVIPGLSEETRPMREEAPQMADAVILKPTPSYEDDDAIGDSGEE